MEGTKEINQKIAEKVMGWHKGKFPGIIDPWLNKRGEATSHRQALWSPWTNIAHAWEVLEKMSKEYYFVKVSSIGSTSWLCQLLQKNTSAYFQAEAKTVSEAICLAALEAVEENGE